MVANPTILLQHSNTPSLQYPMIDRLFDCKQSYVSLIIGDSSVILGPGRHYRCWISRSLMPIK